MLRRRAPARANVAAQRWPEVAGAQTQPSPLTAKTNLNPVFARRRRYPLSKRWEVAASGVAPRPSARVVWQSQAAALLPGPAHELFGSRKLRLAPQDYSPWTPPTDRFFGP